MNSSAFIMFEIALHSSCEHLALLKIVPL